MTRPPMSPHRALAAFMIVTHRSVQPVDRHDTLYMLTIDFFLASYRRFMPYCGNLPRR
jgi:hypothetical protein